MIFAVIPAAGKSVRMGRPKLALPLGTRRVLEHVIAALRQAAAKEILVVVGPAVPQLASLARTAGAAVLQLDQDTLDMRATVERGLQWLEQQYHPGDEDAWLLMPADHPALDGIVVRQLLEARTAHPDRSLFLPTYQGQRGHPALLAWKHVAAIRKLPPGQGLNMYMRTQEAETLEVPVTSATVLCDLDTPEDYERLGKKYLSSGEMASGGRKPPDSA